MRGLNLKNLFVLSIVSILPNLLFAADAALSCNPEADCRIQTWVPCGTWQYPLRSCPGPSSDEPTCAAVRAACRTKCGNLNNDANAYISTYQTQQAQIKSELTEKESDLSKNKELLQGSEQLNAYSDYLCKTFEAFSLKLVFDLQKKKEFIYALTELLNISSTDKKEESLDPMVLYNKIDSLKIEDETKMSIKTFILISNNSLSELELVVAEYIKSNNSSNVQDFNELIKGASKNCLFAKRSQDSLKLLFKSNFNSSEKRIKELNELYNLLSGQIQQQEARKCR